MAAILGFMPALDRGLSIATKSGIAARLHLVRTQTPEEVVIPRTKFYVQARRQHFTSVPFINRARQYIVQLPLSITGFISLNLN